MTAGSRIGWDPTLEWAGRSDVHLDARHDERSAREDLGAWWPLVRPTGVIAGHEYLDGMRPEGVFMVRSAVDAFLESSVFPST